MRNVKEEKQLKLMVMSILLFIVIFYSFIHIFRNITYEKAYISDSSIINTTDNVIAYVSAGDMYNKKEILPHIIIFKNGKRIKSGVIRVNKNLIYRTDNYDSKRISLKEYFSLVFKNE